MRIIAFSMQVQVYFFSCGENVPNLCRFLHGHEESLVDQKIICWILVLLFTGSYCAFWHVTSWPTWRCSTTTTRSRYPRRWNYVCPWDELNFSMIDKCDLQWNQSDIHWSTFNVKLDIRGSLWLTNRMRTILGIKILQKYDLSTTSVLKYYLYEPIRKILQTHMYAWKYQDDQ